VHHGERDRRGGERLARHMQHDDGVLTAGEEKAWTLHLRRNFAEDVDALRLQGGELAHHVALHS